MSRPPGGERGWGTRGGGAGTLRGIVKYEEIGVGIEANLFAKNYAGLVRFGITLQCSWGICYPVPSVKVIASVGIACGSLDGIVRVPYTKDKWLGGGSSWPRSSFLDDNKLDPICPFVL